MSQDAELVYACEVLLSLAHASAATCSSLGSEDIVVLLEKVLRKGPITQAEFKALAKMPGGSKKEYAARLPPPTDFNWAMNEITRGKLQREVAVRAMSCRVLSAIGFGESKPVWVARHKAAAAKAAVPGDAILAKFGY